MRVLFVDDEIQVLRGIQRMLDSADVDWEVATATAGSEAIEHMKKQPVDVLVSDMKMPGMDGAQLLDEVSRLFPSTVRIVLSGQADKATVYKAVSPMHQYLAKPCEAEELRETIGRACTLRQMLDDPLSKQLLGKISSLPSLPQIYQEVVAELECEDTSATRVGNIVAKDPAMTAKILQLANSAIFGLRNTVTCPARAASLIGLEAFKSFVLTLEIFQAFEGAHFPGFCMNEMVNHSMLVGKVASKIAKSEQLERGICEESFTSGLLHDIGKLILATYFPIDYGQALSLEHTHQLPAVEAEREIFGLGHDGIGSYLLALWGLPQSIVESVAFHHCLEQAFGVKMTPATVVCIANFLVHEHAGDHPTGEDQPIWDLIHDLGLADRVDHWMGSLDKSGDK